MQKQIEEMKAALKARVESLGWKDVIALALGKPPKTPDERQINVAYVTVSPAKALALLRGLTLPDGDTPCEIPGVGAVLIITDDRMEYSGAANDIRLIHKSAQDMAAYMTCQTPVDPAPNPETK